MYWVLENNLTDKGYLTLIESLKKYKIDYRMVKVIPSTNILVEPGFDTFKNVASEKDNIHFSDKKIFPFGTMGLSSVGTQRKWSGAMFNEEFNFEKWSVGFGLNNLLNENSKIMKLSDELIFDDELFFVRPCEDNKAFAGQEITKTKFLEWQKTINDNNNILSKLNNETEITIAPYKKISKEARMFVINGEYITGSYYRMGGKVFFEEIKYGDPIIKYTQEMIKRYNPAKAFVIDIALIEDEFKIIEINNINSVGLYEANVNKFIEGIMNL
jgi:hypothetical protein